MALQRSANENIRGYATRIIADANYDASALRLSSAEAGVSCTRRTAAWAP